MRVKQLFVRVLCGLSLIGSVALAAPEPGLIAEYSVDRDGDGLEETFVCGNAQPWLLNEHLQADDRALYMRYEQGTTPCAEIKDTDRWRVDFTGLFRIKVDNASVDIPLDMVADVNDGLRLTVHEADSGNQVCGIEFWRNVPSRGNYQSTDASGISNVCNAPLRSDVWYDITIAVYHQSESRANALHNRAYLALYFEGIQSFGGKVEYAHEPEGEVKPEIEIDNLFMNTWARDGGTQLDISMQLFTYEIVDVALLRKSVLQCLEF